MALKRISRIVRLSTQQMPLEETSGATITVTRVAKKVNSSTKKEVESLADDAALRARVVALYPVRNDWTMEEVREIYEMPLLELIREAGAVHRAYWDASEVQRCTLLSIKTGGCTENCKYCSQSVRYKTHVKPTRQLAVDQVVAAAKRAKAAGSSRFCMGAAWRELGNKQKAFNDILDMVQQISNEGLEVCATLGMLNQEQAKKLKEAGLTAYNHNLDTSRDFYPSVVTSRSYDDRLETIANVRAAGISVCSGGILGLGEEHQDRASMLHTYATLPGGHPESLPVNALVPVEGTPMANNQAVSAFEVIRMIAAARILLPTTMVRLSAGRLSFSESEQALMFLAGANSIFDGDKLLTTPNPDRDEDSHLFDTLGITGVKPTPRFNTTP
uniref:biotin synthase n=1 Tax=Aureoumbra lagunensis TaxID=44058 RepID=A0A7S3JUI9_9STRA